MKTHDTAGFGSEALDLLLDASAPRRTRSQTSASMMAATQRSRKNPEAFSIHKMLDAPKWERRPASFDGAEAQWAIIYG
jgi:hypothetical protein